MLDALRQTLAVGDRPAALECCRAWLREQPDDADTHRYMSQILAAGSEHGPALRHARKACDLTPDDPRAWSNLGRVRAMAAELPLAVASFERAVRIDPGYADGWHNLGTALKKLGNREAAFTALKQALLLDPTRAETYLNLGSLLIDSDQFEDAVECFERAARHDPKMASARSRWAEQLSQSGKVKQAESLFRQALGLDPDHVAGWFGLGQTLEDLGEAEQALGCYRNVLNCRPGHAHALGRYLTLARDGGDAALLSQAEDALVDDTATDEGRALVGYGLIKYHDRRRNYAQAARAGVAANAARRRANGPLDYKRLAARIEGLTAMYGADFFAERRHYGLGTDQPVFIVGLPRSGTTLTEQILSAHPLLYGAGELPDLARLVVGSLAVERAPWQAAEGLDQVSSRDYARRYLRALRDGVPKRRLRISDKSPLNFFHLAFAALLFPNARVIHCRRDVRDNALSIWMENFNPEQRYATDFGDLAIFHAQYQRLMAHWREVLPLSILEVRYEEVVADLEGQARRLIDFLGVPWDVRCLDFHQSMRAVQTPSRWQVRQPIYTSSVGRWRHYQDYLPALTAAFPESGNVIGSGSDSMKAAVASSRSVICP